VSHIAFNRLFVSLWRMVGRNLLLTLDYEPEPQFRILRAPYSNLAKRTYGTSACLWCEQYALYYSFTIGCFFFLFPPEEALVAWYAAPK